MRMLAALIAVLILLQGCAVPITAQSYGTIDRREKTITVSIGSQGIVGKLKQSLVNESWKLVVYTGPGVTEGKIANDVKLKTYQSFTTRYRLLATSRQYDTCLLPGPVSPLIQYDISLIDNENGSEVFTLGGKGCESAVIDAFQSALKSHTK